MKTMANDGRLIGRQIRDGKLKAATETLMAVMRGHGGNAVHAAIACGVHHATFKRWVAKLSEGTNLRDQIDALRVRTTGVDPLSAEQRHAKEQGVKVARDTRRALAWFAALPEDQWTAIAKEARTSKAMVRAIATDDTVSPSAKIRLMEVAQVHLAQISEDRAQAAKDRKERPKAKKNLR